MLILKAFTALRNIIPKYFSNKKETSPFYGGDVFLIYMDKPNRIIYN